MSAILGIFFLVFSLLPFSAHTYSFGHRVFNVFTGVVLALIGALLVVAAIFG